jgi:hypothetical protein
VQAKEQQYEKDFKRWETEEKLRTIDALEWYPTALKVSLLT